MLVSGGSDFFDVRSNNLRILFKYSETEIHHGIGEGCSTFSLRPEDIARLFVFYVHSVAFLALEGSAELGHKGKGCVHSYISSGMHVHCIYLVAHFL